jgi:hypothetical protein
MKITTRRIRSSLCFFCFLALPFVVGRPGPNCPVVESIGKFGAPPSFPAPFFPAFTEYVHDDDEHCLFISSFAPPWVPGGVDLVAKVTNIEDVEEEDEDSFSFQPQMEILTGSADVVWPNDITRLPDDVFGFPALLIPQGFFLSALGRLTAIDLRKDSNSNYPEYIIQESTATAPWFYHNAVFHDMDGDGLLDIITVRSAQTFNPPSPFPLGQLVWFKNPGALLSPTDPWDEVILFSGSGPDPPNKNNAGPDILIRMEDLDGDGTPEFVCTSFFSVGAFSPDVGKVTLFGAPTVGGWAVVNAMDATAPTVRTKTIVDNQGKPFGLEIVDLNGDQRPDLLLTNHQPLNASTIKGRVVAVEQPQQPGDIFIDDWTTHILLDDIEPTPGPSRLAPGFAKAIYPFPAADKSKQQYKGVKPWILVGGDQSGKVWLLSPADTKESQDWDYSSEIIFDAGQGTIGDQIGVKSLNEKGEVILYIPVYEAGEIYVFRLKNDCTTSGSRRRLRGPLSKRRRWSE